MAKKQFKAESKRLLDLMINSIYTHKDIFLREILSNASDAIDKLAYLSLTDDKVGMNRDDFEIRIQVDKENRTLTVSDNGIGMTQEELEKNLGTIAKSGSFQFKKELDSEQAEQEKVDIIGQFGVGFYSAFMVSDEVRVISRAYGQEEAFEWVSSGTDGYTVSPASRDSVGTDVIMHLKEDSEEENYSEYLESYRIEGLVKKYSDYVHTPIRMQMETSKMKPLPEDAPEGTQPEWETVVEDRTLNSMVPIWQRNKNDVTKEDTDRFYQEKFGDYEPPLATIQVSAEGAITYKALLYIPAKAPYDFYTRDYQKGLQLYSSGVMIMEHCEELVPDHFRFVRGIVDSQDFSINISREMLQHTRQLSVITKNLERKIKQELLKIQKEKREDYEKFFASFGRQLKYGVVSEFGANKDVLKDLLLFPSTREGKLVTIQEYLDHMKEDQKYIYYASGENVEQIRKLPQAERILNKEYEILCLTQDEDEFVVQALREESGKTFKSIDADDALETTEQEKKEAETTSEKNRELLEYMKDLLKDQVSDVRISSKLVSHPVFLTADGPITLEMEKYFSSIQTGEQAPKATRVLEVNPSAPAFAALQKAYATDRPLADKYIKILYQQSLLIAGLPLPDPAEYTDLVCSLMN